MLLARIKSRITRSIKTRYHRLRYVRGLVYRRWYYALRVRLALSSKIKIGFGPVTTAEDDLAERKWRIDPVVNAINKESGRFRAGIFFTPEEMAQFDMIVVVKKFNPSYFPVISALKKAGKRFVYDIIDNPNCGPPHDYYYSEHPELISNMDGFILSTPLHRYFVSQFNKPSILIEHPVIHSVFKNKYESNTVTILAHGYYENLKSLKYLEPLIVSVAKETNQKIVLCYHSEVVFEDTEHIKYVKWTVDNCFEIMRDVDVAISIKQLDVLHQKTKPSTKVIAFMAAGLPVICFPSVADRMIVNHGVNGFFAYNEEDWRKYLTMLVINPLCRKQIGKAARASVIREYSVSSMVARYLNLFEEVLNERV